jgi:putative transposase
MTLRAVSRLRSLRTQAVFLEMRSSLARASSTSFRILQFSVQADHVHLLLEATDKASLSRGAAGLSIRLARAVNRVLRRHGHVWGDRYHARALRTPREVRSGFVYVLTNWRKHLPNARGLDPCSSAFWFDGWKGRAERDEPPWWDIAEQSPVARCKTWLAWKGWRRHGLILRDEHPKMGRGVGVGKSIAPD